MEPGTACKRWFITFCLCVSRFGCIRVASPSKPYRKINQRYNGLLQHQSEIRFCIIGAMFSLGGILRVLVRYFVGTGCPFGRILCAYVDYRYQHHHLIVLYLLLVRTYLWKATIPIPCYSTNFYNHCQPGDLYRRNFVGFGIINFFMENWNLQLPGILTFNNLSKTHQNIREFISRDGPLKWALFLSIEFRILMF